MKLTVGRVVFSVYREPTPEEAQRIRAKAMQDYFAEVRRKQREGRKAAEAEWARWELSLTPGWQEWTDEALRA